ncbi:NmrA family NAD(P)-binding protein [Chroococcidiopsis cubana]|uniref:NmrA family NAD(P)-binding protein n=1 Tax=Chroococcidiopsis cubana TaxID=171392 RepID=UPI0021593154|nr:NmrA family NAD(P)-binding protein [Chroococcidiopsis cubana]
MRGVERVFLLTGYTVDMLAQSKAIVDEAVKADVQHIVHIGAYAKEDTTVAHLGWHQLIERYIESSGIAYTHLRPNYFMQNLLRLPNTNNPGVIHQFFGEARLGWIDADDIALVAATVLRSPERYAGQIIPLAVEALTGDEIAEVLTQSLGQPYRYQAQSPDDLLAQLLSVGMEPAYARCAVDVNRRLTTGTMSEAADTFDNFESITGRKPNYWKDFALKHRDKFRY